MLFRFECITRGVAPWFASVAKNMSHPPRGAVKNQGATIGLKGLCHPTRMREPMKTNLKKLACLFQVLSEILAFTSGRRAQNASSEWNGQKKNIIVNL